MSLNKEVICMGSKILVSSDNSLFIKTLKKSLENASIEVVLCGNTCEEIMDALEKDNFDMVYIYTLKGKASSAEFIDKIHSQFTSIRILLSVYHESYNIINSLTISDRVKCVVMPMSIKRLTEIIRRLLEQKKSDVYSYIADYLYLLGLRKNYNGFSYLCSAIALCLEDPTRVNAIVKRIYDEVGKEYGVGGIIIDRSIRHLSKAVYEDGLVPVLTCGQLTEKMTNYELICSAGDRFVNSRTMNSPLNKNAAAHRDCAPLL